MTRAQVILLCVLRRALYELGRVGGLCGGSLLAGFPWFYTRGSKVAAELKIIEARVLAIAQAACVTDAQKTFLSDSLAAVWARPLLTDLLLIARLDALTPANDERKMGDYSDTVSTQEIQQLLQLRGLERAQPKGANTMSSGPPPSAPNMEGERVLPLHVLHLHGQQPHATQPHLQAARFLKTSTTIATEVVNLVIFSRPKHMFPRVVIHQPPGLPFFSNTRAHTHAHTQPHIYISIRTHFSLYSLFALQ